MSFKEALEWKHKDNKVRVESEQILSVPKWHEVSAHVSEAAKVLKEGSK